MRIALLVSLLLCAPAWGAYKCVDEKGATHFGDAPPPACATVKMYELGKSGAVVRTIEPTGSAADQRAGAAEKAKSRDNDRAAIEAKRRDAALVDTYNSEREIDAARDRNLELLKARLGVALARQKPLEEREKELERTIETHKAMKPGKTGFVPVALRADLEKVQAEKAAVAASIARFEAELEQMRKQFDADKKRWIELRGSR